MALISCNNPQNINNFADSVMAIETTHLVSGSLLLPLGKDIRSLLGWAAQAAGDRGWRLYLVGGVVRDLLLYAQESAQESDRSNSTANSQPRFTDIDLVVDSSDSSAPTLGEGSAEAGVELAQLLHETYPQARLEIHGDFHTAALRWQEDSLLGSLAVDLATTRTETYPYPAANPQVTVGSIRQDLYRRDFTINALTLELTGGTTSEEATDSNVGEKSEVEKSRSPDALELQTFAILDFFGGWQDLLDKQVRVLHAQSFIDDPTRIYRAVRFAVRLGFEIEPQTKKWIHNSIARGTYQQYYAQMQTAQIKVPALQSRLRTEIKYLFQSSYYQQNLQLLGKLEALQCLHPRLELNDKLWRRVRLGDRLLQLWHQFLAHNPEPHATFPPDWLLRLELVIATLPVSDRTQVANNLQLPLDSVSRLQQLTLVESSMFGDLSVDLSKGVTNLAVSQVVQSLKCYEYYLLLLTAMRSSRRERRQLWQYLTISRLVRSPLDGKDLKKLGYQPGKTYKLILEALTTATLDGLITNYESALVFLAKHFPLPP